MSLSDPFSTTYEGSFKAGQSLGAGLNDAAGNVADTMKLNNNRKTALNMLKQFGMINTKTEEPSLDELVKGAKDFAKSQGHDLNVNYGDNPEQAKQNIMGIYKALNIPLPQGKTTTELNLAPGTEYDPIKGDVQFKNPKSFLSTIGLDNVPKDMEVVGYDQKGQPMVRKIKRDVPAEKFDTEQQDKKKSQEERGQIVLDSAKETLDTIGEVEKGIDNFGAFGDLPSIPGTNRVNWQANVDKLLSGKILDVMTKLKEASKTGGTGFGQLSNKELQVLTNASTALKKNLPKEQAAKYLNDMKNSIQKIVDNKSGEFDNLPQENLPSIKIAVNPKTGEKMILKDGKWQKP